MSGSFASQVHLITGAGTGIGKVAAKLFAREGASVVLVGRTVNNLEGVADEIRSEGGNALVAPADVGRGDEVDRVFRRAVEAFGPVDVLVNYAGSESFGNIDELTEAQWDERQGSNFKHYFLTAKAALTIGRMKERRSGLIINTASTLVRASHPGITAHIAFKHAALGFTESLQKEVAEYNIRVTLLCPGAVSTDWAMSDRLQKQILKLHPRPSYVTAEDVAEVTRYIISLPPHVNIGELSIFAPRRIT